MERTWCTRGRRLAAAPPSPDFVALAMISMHDCDGAASLDLDAGCDVDAYIRVDMYTYAGLK